MSKSRLRLTVEEKLEIIKLLESDGVNFAQRDRNKGMNELSVCTLFKQF